MNQQVENMDPRLKSFIASIDQIVKTETDEQVITSKVAEEMKALMKHEGIIPEAYRKPNPTKYTLYPLYVAPDNSFSIASAVWDVGQSTPVHDHRTWGVIGIVQGEEYEAHYDFSPNTKPTKVMERHLRKGDVAVCCTSDQDVHKVSCASSEPCVGIHVYGGNIGEIERGMYDLETGEVKTIVTSWDPVPTA